MILLSSEEKARLRLSVNPEVLDYIEEIKEEQNLSFTGDAVSFLVADYKRLKKEQWSLNYVAEVVSQNLHETLKEELTRVRLGTNNTDRNTQILIELVNGMMVNDNVEDIMTTDQLESGGLVTAKNVVQERIENKRQKRVEWEASRQK
jgi:lipopolysaccharide biosynthesis regulator YciM